MSVTTGRIHGSASFILDIRTLSCPGALFDWNAMIVLCISPRETGTKLKFCESATASKTLVGGAGRLYNSIKDAQSPINSDEKLTKKDFFHILCVELLGTLITRTTILNYLPL